MCSTASSVRLALLLLLLPSVAHAQASAAAHHSANLVHTTVAVSSFPGTDLLGLGARVSLRTGRRSAIEVGADWTDALHARRWADQIMWFYFWQMKHPIWADQRTSVFATYGTSSWVDGSRFPRDACGPRWSFRSCRWWASPLNTRWRADWQSAWTDRS